MLAQKTNFDKENSTAECSRNASKSSVQAALWTLQEELSDVRRDSLAKEKQSSAEIAKWKRELDECKKKLSLVNEKYLLSTIIRDKSVCSDSMQSDSPELREKDMLIEELKTNIKQQQQAKQQLQGDMDSLKRELVMLKMEKDKVMEMGLLEKIQLQERNGLLEKEVRSKKAIISSMRKEMDKMCLQNSDIAIQQRKMQQKSKQLECYEEQIRARTLAKEAQLQSKISQLQKENEFLSEHVKKMSKLVGKRCKCEQQNDTIRDNLFEISRQLALAKVKLGGELLVSQRQKGQKDQKERSESSSSASSKSSSGRSK